MVPDTECLKIVSEILDDLELTNHVIKINHRKLIEAIYEICNVPSEKFRTASSSIDKLDKIGWDGVKALFLENSISEDVYNNLYSFIKLNGKFLDVLTTLRSNEKLQNSKKACEALNDIDLILKYSTILKISDKVRDFYLNEFCPYTKIFFKSWSLI